MSGWIKLHRQITDCWLWSGEFSQGQAWIDLLMKANHKPKTVEIKGQLIHIERGEQARSVLTLSKEWKWSRNRVIRFLDKLEKENMIQRKSGHLTTIIRISKYKGFQDGEFESDTSVDTSVGASVDTSVDTTDDTSVGTQHKKGRIKEGKEGKKGRNKNIYAEQVSELFDYWCSVFNKNSATKLSTKRKQRIEQRLKEGYTVDQLKCAILGCSNSDYHIENGYTDIELICREPEKVDRFIELNRPKPADVAKRSLDDITMQMMQEHNNDTVRLIG